MKKTALLILGFAFLASCEAMFTTNIFDSLDNLDLSSMSTEEKAGAVLDDTAGAIEGMSQTEIDELINDLTALADDTSASDNTRMQAAAAAAEVELTASGANETINNLSTLATDLINGDTTINDPSDVLTNLFSGSADDIETQLNAMLAAAASLETYGDVLGSSGTAPAGVNPEDVAVTALVAGFILSLSQADADGNGTDNTTAEIAAAIADPASAGNMFDSLPDISTISNDPSSLFSSNDGLINIVEGSELYSSLLGSM
ncbi:MAG: hypothetical protein JXA95_18000 [Spirochaetales bacterium]|nr:hypothetical protein [Spirochaetales bacterium]